MLRLSWDLTPRTGAFLEPYSLHGRVCTPVPPALLGLTQLTRSGGSAPAALLTAGGWGKWGLCLGWAQGPSLHAGVRAHDG